MLNKIFPVGPLAALDDADEDAGATDDAEDADEDATDDEDEGNDDDEVGAIDEDEDATEDDAGCDDEVFVTAVGAGVAVITLTAGVACEFCMNK